MDNWLYHLLMSPGCEFRHNPSIPLMDQLRRNNIGTDFAVTKNSRGRFVAR